MEAREVDEEDSMIAVLSVSREALLAVNPAQDGAMGIFVPGIEGGTRAP